MILYTQCVCRALNLEGDLEFLKYTINIEKASMIYLFPVQKEHVKRKWLDLEAVLNIKIYLRPPSRLRTLHLHLQTYI
jgi:hypothetical protein